MFKLARILKHAITQVLHTHKFLYVKYKNYSQSLNQVNEVQSL